MHLQSLGGERPGANKLDAKKLGAKKPQVRKWLQTLPWVAFLRVC